MREAQRPVVEAQRRWPAWSGQIEAGGGGARRPGIGSPRGLCCARDEEGPCDEEGRGGARRWRVGRRRKRAA